MKNLKYIFTLSMAALLGLSLTACSEDDYNTDPYAKSGVNLLAFGPSPNTRAGEIRITGTNLSKVDKVVFAGGTIERAGKTINLTGAEVDRAAFNASDNENIYVNIPDETVPGNISLVAGSETIVSEGLLTFKEPIEVTSVSPTSGLSAGDEISIKGDYVYNIAEVVFTSGVAGAPVEAVDFTYVSRHEIRLIVPLAAEPGPVTFTDGADWEEAYATPLDIITASVTGMTENADFGQTVTISGVNLHTVESIMFPGGVAANFTVSADHKTITTQVPAETMSGTLSLVLYSGDAISTPTLNVPTLAVDNVSKTKDLKVGDVVTVTGQNFDRITKVSLPGIGETNAYTISGNTLTFTVTEDMTDGSVDLTQNSFISFSFRISMYSEAPENTIWGGTFVCSSWNGNQDLAWGGYDWTTVAANTPLKFYYEKNNPGQWGCISLRHGQDWGNLPAPIPGQYDLPEDKGVLTVVFPQNVLDDLIANGGLVITGDNYTLTKVTIPSAETVLWKGEVGPTNWDGNIKIDLTDEMKAELQPGKKMGIDFRCDDGGGQVEICGLWWTGLEGPKNVYGTDADGRAIMNFAADVTNFEWTLTQGDIDILTQQGGILFVGNGGLVITRWYVK